MPQYPDSYYAEKAAREARRAEDAERARQAGITTMKLEIATCEEHLLTETDPDRIAAYNERIADNRRRLAEA